MGWIDIHEHVVYGVDDGASSFEDSQQMLRDAKAQRVSTIFATSHASPGTEPFPLKQYLSHLSRLQDWIEEENLGITLLPGAEILYAPSAVERVDSGEIPTLGDSGAVLVEFFPSTEYDQICKAVRKFLNAGYMPVIAHVERYGCLRDRNCKRAEELSSMGARLQMNARTVIRNTGLFKDRFVHNLLYDGHIDFVASDAHGAKHGRPVCIAEACETVKKQTDLATVKALFRNKELITEREE